MTSAQTFWIPLFNKNSNEENKDKTKNAFDMSTLKLLSVYENVCGSMFRILLQKANDLQT